MCNSNSSHDYSAEYNLESQLFKTTMEQMSLPSIEDVLYTIGHYKFNAKRVINCSTSKSTYELIKAVEFQFLKNANDGMPPPEPGLGLFLELLFIYLFIRK